MGACKSRATMAWTTVQNDFLVLHMPKHILIQNTRLGLVFRMLQLACLIGLGIYCSSMDAYYEHATATPKGLMLWKESPNAQKVAQSDVLHCRQPQRYAYNWTTSKHFSFMPTSCKELLGEEILLPSRSEDEIAFATHIQDTINWRGSGDQCSADAQRWCLNISARASYNPSSSDGSCSCSLLDDFFVKNPEEQRITFIHGFEVDFGGGDESGRIQQGSKNRVPYFSSSSTKSNDMLTVIMLPDYTDTCVVGGKSEWKRTDLANGITGTLRDWLNCAGVTMDSNPEGMLQDSAVGLSPHLRTMGFRLELTLEYTHDAHTYPEYAIVCKVTANVVPAWQTRMSTDYVLMSALDGGRRAWRNRLAHGVIIQLKVKGAFRKFDFKKFLDFFVSALVILQLPFHISEFIALYMLGFISEIHRSAKRSKLNVSNDFYSTIARMLVAEVAFRGLMGGQWRGSIRGLSGLSCQDLLRHMYGVFDEEIQNDVLQRHELERMAIATFSYLDDEGKGLINANDFIRECSANEAISVTNAAKLFDDEQGYSMLQRIFDSSHSQRMKLFRKTDSQVEMRRSMSGSVEESDDDDTAGLDDSHEDYASTKSAPPRENSTASTKSAAPRENSAFSLGSKGDLMRGERIVDAQIESRIQALEEKDREAMANVEAMQLENRIAALEAAENRRRIQALQQGKSALAKDVQDAGIGLAEVEKASLPVVEKDKKTMSSPPIFSGEKGQKASDVAHAMAQLGVKAKGGTDADQRILDIVTKTQHLDDAIAHLREKMDLRFMRLEALINHQERQICLALEERCTSMEDRLQESVASVRQHKLHTAEGHFDVERAKNNIFSEMRSRTSSDGLASSAAVDPQTMLQEAAIMLSEDDDEPATRHIPRTHSGLNDMLKGARTVAVWHPFAEGERPASARQHKRSDSEPSKGTRSGARGSSSARGSSNVGGSRPFR